MLSRLMLTAVVSLVAVTGAGAATYEVGPGKPYATPSAVPWESLQAGDLVLIHWRSTPYKDKWAICRQGTASAPIVVRGVAGPAGERPVIDGNGAVTRLQLDYWGEQRAVIKIGGSSVPADVMPRNIPSRTDAEPRDGRGQRQTDDARHVQLHSPGSRQPGHAGLGHADAVDRCDAVRGKGCGPPSVRFTLMSPQRY